MTNSDIGVKIWDDKTHGVLSEDRIRQQYVPSDRYRISKQKYPKFTNFMGVMRKGTCYVLEGSCRYRFRETTELKAGQYIEFEKGEYEFEVVGNSDVVLVLVWPLLSAIHLGNSRNN